MAWITTDYQTGPIKACIDHYVTDTNELDRIGKEIQMLENAYNEARNNLQRAKEYLAPRLNSEKVYVIGTYAVSVTGQNPHRYIKIDKAEVF